MDQQELGRRIDQGIGREAADLVIKGARILNVATGSLDPGDIAGVRGAPERVQLA